jgi:hypothetical protein
MRYIMHAHNKYIHVFNLYVVISYFHTIHVHCNHRHLRNMDCLMVRTTCLVCFISTVNGCSKKKKEKKPITSGASSGHITKLKQSILLRCL